MCVLCLIYYCLCFRLVTTLVASLNIWKPIRMPFFGLFFRVGADPKTMSENGSLNLIMMLNLLLFPRFFHVYFCTSNTTRSKRFQTHTQALGPPVSGIEEAKNNPYLHVVSYRSGRGPLSTLPRSLPVPRMKRFAFDVALANPPIRRLAMNSRITNHELSGTVSDRCQL